MIASMDEAGGVAEFNSTSSEAMAFLRLGAAGDFVVLFAVFDLTVLVDATAPLAERGFAEVSDEFIYWKLWRAHPTQPKGANKQVQTRR